MIAAIAKRVLVRLSDFCYLCLFASVIALVANTILVMAMGFDLDNNKYGADSNVLCVLLIPTIAVAYRRMHDIGESGRWCLIIFTCIGIIPFIIWCVKKGEERENQYGDNPLASPLKVENP